MGLEDRMRAKMQNLLRETSDAGLTEREIRRKYEDDAAPAPATGCP